MKTKSLLILVGATVMALWAMPGTARGQIMYETNGDGTIGEYNATTGATINASLISGLSAPYAIAISGGYLFVVNRTIGTIGEYNATTGATINASLISGLGVDGPISIAVSGSNLFVGNTGTGTVGEYTTSGATVNASLISGLGGNLGMALSGSNLFVTNGYSTIGEYTTSGATVNVALISGLTDAGTIAICGTRLYVVNEYNDRFNNHIYPIGEYTTSGGTVNASLLYTNSPTGIAVFGGHLFVGDLNDGTIGQYDDTTGGTINGSFVSGLNGPLNMVIADVPDAASTWTLLLLAIVPMFGLNLLVHRQSEA